MLNLFRNLPNLVKLVLTGLAVTFIGVVFFAILKSRQSGYQGHFRLLVEPINESFTTSWDNLEKSFSYSFKHQSRSFSYSLKPLKNYFCVEVDDNSIRNFIEPLIEDSQKRDLVLTFSLSAKRDLKGKIFAYFYEANGSLIKRASSSDSLGSTHLISKHYPSFISGRNPEGSSWQWRRNEKYQMIFRVPHNTYKIQVFFEESR
jgi:hypothetical protein